MKNVTENLAEILIEKKWYFLISLVILTLCTSFFLKNLKIDNSIEVWFLKDDPTLADYQEFKEIYGNDEVVVALIKSENGIFTKNYAKKIYNISNHLKENSLVKRVVSISKAPYIGTNNANELLVEEMVATNPKNDFDSQAFKKKLLSDPLWEKLLLGKEFSSSILLVEPIVSSGYDKQRPEFITFVKQTLSDLDYKLGGMGVVYEELNRISMNDTGLFTSLSYLILILALIIFIRKLSILITATLTMLFSVFLFLGIFGISGQSFNMVSAILPSLVIIISIADIVHIYAHYDKTTGATNRLQKNFSYILIPCLFTTLTTATGFLALYTSPMAVLKYFGVFAAIGICIAYGVSMIISVCILSIQEKMLASKPVNSRHGITSRQNDYIDSLINHIINFIHKRYKIIVPVGGLMILIAFAGIIQIKVDTYSMGFLLDNNTVKQHSQYLEKNYGNYVPLEVRLKPESQFGVKDPVFLQKLTKLQNRLDQHPELGKSASLADIVKQLNKVLTDGTKASYKIPENHRAVAQELLLYEMDKDNNLSSYVDRDYTETRFTVRIPMTSSKQMSHFMKLVRTEIKNIFSHDAQVVFGGYIPLYVKMMDYIVVSQINSFLIAFGVIFVIMALLFRSLSIIILGFIPNLLPIFLTLGFMGWSGVNLDIATVTIAAIVIGISVDDTIHFIFMYKKKRQEGHSVEQAVEYTLRTSGKAIIITSALLMLGYSVLVLASIKSVIYMGILISISMFSALLADLFLLPSLLILLAKKKCV